MLGAVYKDMIAAFEEAGIDTPELDARYILQERCGLGWSDILTRPSHHIDDSSLKLIRQDMSDRMSGKPVSRIFGMREFWGMTFRVSEHTLDPRPDTETIIDLALKRFDIQSSLTFLDLGTGTGCILMALLSEFKNANGVAVDLSCQALEIARENAALHGMEDRIRFIQGAWLDGVDGQFDLIVSIPPYIRTHVIPELSPEVKNHDPILALDGGKDGLAPYKEIFRKIKIYLKPRGIGLFEIGYDQSDDVMRLAEESGFAQRCVHLDMAGNPRVVEISNGDK